MRKLTILIAVALGCVLSWGTTPQAQSAKPADWLTDGGDIERTAWQRNETILSTTSVKNMKLLWKTRLDNEPRQMHNLLPALIASNVKTASGLKQISLVTGVSDNLYALDAETGEQIWKLHFDSNWTPPATGGRGGGVLCPGGITATPVIGPGKAAGEYIVYAASWDGRLRRVDLATGKEIVQPARFMPPNGKPYALNLFKNAIYVHTAQGCGGNPNMVYIFKVEDKAGKYWLTPVWISRDMDRAEPPVIANGVIFAYGSGEDTDQARYDIGLAYNRAEYRIKGSTMAALYALDAQTGKELWNSGEQIASWNHWGGLSVANGRVYISTFDGYQYCFGIVAGEATQSAAKGARQ